MNEKFKKNNWGSITIILFVFLGFPFVILASTTNGTIDSTYKYAWGANTGWINFGNSGGNVHVTDSALTGYAWNDNYGWINLNPTTSGVTNNSEGTLSGYAWGEGLGWINFSGVIINSSGVFTGTATGDNSGQISFDCTNCSVKTDWRPASARVVANTGGGSFPSSAFVSSASLSGGVPIKINNGAKYTVSRTVTLNLQAGSNVAMMAISNYPDFRDTSQEIYMPKKSWDICYQLSSDCPVENATYNVYVKFYSGKGGSSSETNSASVIFVKEIPETPAVSTGEPPSSVPPVLTPEQEPPAKPIEIIFGQQLPEGIPLVMQFAPLSEDAGALVQKFPQLEKEISDAGINITDLKNSNFAFSLPNLTEVLGLPTLKIEIGKFALSVVASLDSLSSQIKDKLPTGVIFVRTGGESIDFNVSLIFKEKGKVQQKISALSGKQLTLMLKPEKPVNSVKGYVAKSKLKTSSRISPSLFGLLFSVQPVFAEIQTQSANLETRLVLTEFEYIDPDFDGIYTAKIMAPSAAGEYEIITSMDYKDPTLEKKEIGLTMIVDPEGYIYEKKGNKEMRIPEATVSLYQLNTETKQYELWPAEQYQQQNPQITDVTGKYSFIAPTGFYYLKTEAPGYLSYTGEPFQINQGGGINVNIELKTKYSLLRLFNPRNVVLGLILIIIILAGYNFYRNRIRKIY